MGMSPEQYWDEDCTLATAYRRAQEIRDDRENQQLWLLGHYVYDALLCVAPLYRTFKPQRPRDYVDSPYSITKKQAEDKQKEKERLEAEKARAGFRAMVERWNTQFLEKKKKGEEEDNAGTDGRTEL